MKDHDDSYDDLPPLLADAAQRTGWADGEDFFVLCLSHGGRLIEFMAIAEWGTMPDGWITLVEARHPPSIRNHGPENISDIDVHLSHIVWVKKVKGRK